MPGQRRRRIAEHLVEFEVQTLAVVVEDQTDLTRDVGVAFFEQAVGVVEELDAVVAFECVPGFGVNIDFDQDDQHFGEVDRGFLEGADRFAAVEYESYTLIDRAIQLENVFGEVPDR